MRNQRLLQQVGLFLISFLGFVVAMVYLGVSYGVPEELRVILFLGALVLGFPFGIFAFKTPYFLTGFIGFFVVFFVGDFAGLSPEISVTVAALVCLAVAFVVSFISFWK